MKKEATNFEKMLSGPQKKKKKFQIICEEGTIIRFEKQKGFSYIFDKIFKGSI